MAGRIHPEDLETVRERSRIDEVVSAFVALRPAGGGSLTGLCPFHNEKTPSFRVTPAKGFYYCFGCGEGGDVIGFVQKINNMGFTDAVEYLADRCGVQIRYTEGDGGPKHEPGLRMRVLEANAAAAEFFAAQLTSPDAVEGRRFLHGRGFTREHADHFGIGFAPRSGTALREHLLGKKFSRDDLVKAGLVRENGWDFFQGRLVWPIRDSGRSTLGFGARRLFDDDRMPAKYLNTPETLVYKKSHVLYGLDLARTHIGKKNQAVVVEGYTDVMACHIAGVDTAVASCGTAFGADHSRMIDRLMTADAHSGEVVFTFDGDAAGQAAALKVFSSDASFTAQTYVAIEPSGLDPCDLRIQSGDPAVRELVARRVPLYRYVMRNTVERFDLDRADGRLAAVRAAAPLVASVRDAALVSGYLRELAGWVGLNPDEVRAEVTRANARKVPDEPARVRGAAETPGATGAPGGADAPAETTQQALMELPDPRDRRLETERGFLKLAVQQPALFDDAWFGVVPDDFAHPSYARVFGVLAAGDRRAAGFAQAVVAGIDDAVGEQLVVALSVEPLYGEPTAAYAREYASRLRLATVTRRINTLKSRLQRTNPVEQQAEYNRGFAALLELEATRRSLQAAAVGEV
ncbi:DNA primase [Propioniciclava soli]|uniref:DNA primase n=1 Tax=Propioniciclava soli TaxID=2775081 RepID=UPI001E57329D|nr:DNA primase [Propioniciclava soli]